MTACAVFRRLESFFSLSSELNASMHGPPHPRTPLPRWGEGSRGRLIFSHLQGCQRSPADKAMAAGFAVEKLMFREKQLVHGSDKSEPQKAASSQSSHRTPKHRTLQLQREMSKPRDTLTNNGAKGGTS